MKTLINGSVVGASLASVVMLISSVVEAGVPEIVSLKKIWDGAPHNAFTDLIYHQGEWFCAFREADYHSDRPTNKAPGREKAGRHGEVRVIVSSAGDQWESAGLVAEQGFDLRDPKLSVMPDGRMMLLTCACVHDPEQEARGGYRTRSPRVAFSRDGRQWSTPRRVLSEDHWLWRATWHEGRAWSVSKLGESPIPRRAFLYWSDNGIDWNWVNELKLPEGSNIGREPSETTLRFLPDGEMIALIRQHYIGRSRPPYRHWTYTRIGHSLGGPNFLRLPDGRMWCASRINGRTKLARMTVDTFEPVLELPCDGDTGYPGMMVCYGLATILPMKVKPVFTWRRYAWIPDSFRDCA